MHILKKYFVLERDDQTDITLAFAYGHSTAFAWVLIVITALAGITTEVIPDLQHFHLLNPGIFLQLNTFLASEYSYYAAGTIFFFFWQLSRWFPGRPHTKRRAGIFESLTAVLLITFLQMMWSGINGAITDGLKIKQVDDVATDTVVFHGSMWHKFVSYMINNWYELPSEDVFRLSLFSLIFVALLWIKRPTLRYWISFLLTALLFGMWHYSSYSYHMFEAVFNVGLPTLIDGCLWLRTRNLWTFTAGHFLYDYSGNW